MEAVHEGYQSIKPVHEQRDRETVSTDSIKKDLFTVYPWLKLHGERKAKERSPREQILLEGLRRYGELSGDGSAAERAQLRQKIEMAIAEDPPMSLLGVDLSGLDLSDLHFSRVAFYVCDVYGTNFSRVKMNGTRWIFCDMRGSTFNEMSGESLFMHCDMSGTQAEKADFSAATCFGSTFRDARWHNTELNPENFYAADVTNAHIEGMQEAWTLGPNERTLLPEGEYEASQQELALLDQVDMLLQQYTGYLNQLEGRPRDPISERFFQDLQEICKTPARENLDERTKWCIQKNLLPQTLNFDGLDFSGMDLSFLDLSDISMIGCKIEGATVTWTNFSGANLSLAELSNSIFEFSNFFGVLALGTSFRNTVLSMERLRNVVAIRASFDGASLRGTDATRSIYLEASFKDADIEFSQFIDSVNIQGLHQAARVASTKIQR